MAVVIGSCLCLFLFSYVSLSLSVAVCVLVEVFVLFYCNLFSSFYSFACTSRLATLQSSLLALISLLRFTSAAPNTRQWIEDMWPEPTKYNAIVKCTAHSHHLHIYISFRSNAVFVDHCNIGMLADKGTTFRRILFDLLCFIFSALAVCVCFLINMIDHGTRLSFYIFSLCVDSRSHRQYRSCIHRRTLSIWLMEWMKVNG